MMASRLFSCGRNVQGELGLGEYLPEDSKPYSAAENRADPVADLDDELFGMVDKRKITPKPKAATVTEKEKVKPSDDSKGGTFGGRGKDKISVPMEVEETPEGIVLVSCGLYHSAVIAAKNTMYSWGADNSGQCGHGRSTNQWEPKWVMAVTGKVVSDIAGGRTHTLIVAGGQVYTWGASSYGALAQSDNYDQLNPCLVRQFKGIAIKQVSCGCDYSVALSNSGDIYAWGRADTGRLGIKLVKGKRFEHIPRPITGLGGKVASVCAGHSHSLCVMESGILYAWGTNTFGQLGTGDVIPRPTPHRVKIDIPHETFGKMAVSEVSAGARHSLAVVLWFNVVLGQMRTQVLSWGLNRNGQLGLGDKKKNPIVYRPQAIAIFNEFSTRKDEKVFKASGVACGGHHTIVVAEGKGFSFGCGCYGQLGLGDFDDRSVPVLVKRLEKYHISMVACGAWHSVFLTGTPPDDLNRNKWVPFADPSDNKEKKSYESPQTGSKLPYKVPIVPRQSRRPAGILSALFGDGFAMCTGSRK
ncbi:hypothetical protein AAMO2058_001615600 [Amorphochlora amoebiformis]